MADNNSSPFPWASVGGSALGIGIGQLVRGQQNRDQRRFMEIQMKNQMKLNEQGHQLQKDMWDYSNYGNQVEHMKNAGLNVGLMYGGAGASGTTGSQSGGSAQSGTPANQQVGAMGMGLQIQQTQAQNDLIKAQTAATKAQEIKTKAESEKIGGVDTQLAQTQIDSNKIANSFNTENFDTAIEKAKADLENVNANTNKQVAEGNLSVIDGATRSWENTSKILNTIASTNKMNEGVKQEWAKVNQGWKDLELKNKGLDIQQQQANIQKFGAETQRNYPSLMNSAGSIVNNGLKAIYRLFGMDKDDTSTTTKVK